MQSKSKNIFVFFVIIVLITASIIIGLVFLKRVNVKYLTYPKEVKGQELLDEEHTLNYVFTACDGVFGKPDFVRITLNTNNINLYYECEISFFDSVTSEVQTKNYNSSGDITKVIIPTKFNAAKNATVNVRVYTVNEFGVNVLIKTIENVQIYM